MRKRTILMYSRSRGGKTTLLGELAEHVKVTTGKDTLIYSIDKGGIGPIIPLIDLGIITLVSQDDTDPWVFMNKLSNGQVRDEKGKWVPADMSRYGMVAGESLTGFSDAFMNDLAQMSARGINVGGAANVSFTVTDGAESLKIGGNNMGHYNVVQTRILDELWRSQRLPVPFVVWTAGQSKDEDQNAGGKVIGPAIAGKAMTAELLRHFDLSFRLDCTPSKGGLGEEHILYLGNNLDLAAGNAIGLGNTRVPLGAKTRDGKDLPPYIKPASLVQALKMIEEAETVAKEAIKLRLSKSVPKVS